MDLHLFLYLIIERFDLFVRAKQNSEFVAFCKKELLQTNSKIPSKKLLVINYSLSSKHPLQHSDGDHIGRFHSIHS